MQRRYVEWGVMGMLGACLSAGAMGVQSHRETAAKGARPTEAPAKVPITSSWDANSITTTPAALRTLSRKVQVVGSVAYDQDHYAIVGPLVPGRVVDLRASLGSQVRAGQVLAEVESPAVSQARATYLTARAHATAAAANLRRENELAEQRISSAREREVAQAQAAQDDAALRAAEQGLRSLGLSPQDVSGEQSPGRITLVSPIAGTVVKRNVSLGEAVEHGTDAFVIANLAQLWVLLDIYEKDLQHVHVGQRVQLRTESLPGRVLEGQVSYMDMRVDTDTRTAYVRVVFDNREGLLRPGQFVSASLINEKSAPAAAVLTVPRAAVQSVLGHRSVFVRHAGEYTVHQIETGQADEDFVEVVSGLDPNDEVAVEGTFLLKSKLLR